MSPSTSSGLAALQVRVDSLDKELSQLREAVMSKEMFLQSVSERVYHCEQLAGIGIDLSGAYVDPMSSVKHEYNAPGGSHRRSRGDSGDTKDTTDSFLGHSRLEYKHSHASDMSMDFDDATSSGSPSKRLRVSASSAMSRKNQHKSCTFDGCHKMAHGPTYLFCLRHGGGYRCQEAGCTRSAYSTKYCSRHGGGPRCQWDGCVKGAISNSSFCRRHGGGSRCQHPNCPEGARQGFNFCLNHGGFNPCAYANCPGIALLTASYCRQHNAVFKTSSTTAKSDE